MIYDRVGSWPSCLEKLQQSTLHRAHSYAHCAVIRQAISVSQDCDPAAESGGQSITIGPMGCSYCVSNRLAGTDLFPGICCAARRGSFGT